MSPQPPAFPVNTLTPQILPTRRRTLATAGRFARRFQVREQGANPFAPRAGVGAFDVSEAEISRLFEDGREDEFSFRAARRFDLPGPLLEFAIGPAADGEKVNKSRGKITFAVVPAL